MFFHIYVFSYITTLDHVKQELLYSTIIIDVQTYIFFSNLFPGCSNFQWFFPCKGSNSFFLVNVCYVLFYIFFIFFHLHTSEVDCFRLTFCNIFHMLNNSIKNSLLLNHHMVYLSDFSYNIFRSISSHIQCNYNFFNYFYVCQ